ncbi:MAG TPA: sulfotransferase domain-containing protein, partial [Acidimicrobiales bacterium]|nr:sulfotransferase domain-containing protein [Acidimicrobiales bacterium]
SSYRHRAGDIVISTPPKCGTTWTQNIVAMLVFGTSELDRPVSVLSPWLDQVVRPIDEVVADLEAMEHRRFLKTHTPLDGLPQHDDVTYVVVLRDPRDAAVSWGNHVLNLDWARMAELRAAAHGMHDVGELPPRRPPSPDPAERWWAYVGDRAPSPEFAAGLELVARHATLAWQRRHDPNVVLVHYADLEGDLEGEVRRIADRLDLPVPEHDLSELLDAASFSSMRERADVLVPNAGQIWFDQRSFFSSGTSGQWRDVVGEGADERYQELVRQLIADEELLAWLHRP